MSWKSNSTIHYIYKITNSITNKSYIGKSVKPKDRFYLGHCNENSNSHISRSIRKHGVNNFTLSILDVIQFLYIPNREDIKKYVDSREIYFIKLYDTFYNGYNSTKGGEGFDSESSRYYNQIRINLGTHIFQDSELKSKIQRNKVKSGTHIFQDSKRQSENQLRIVERGEHHFQTKDHALKSSDRQSKEYTCPYCHKTGKGTGMFRWHFDKCQYNKNKKEKNNDLSS